MAAAAPRREQAWRAGVRAALDILAETVATEARNAELPDSLLSDIVRNQPWLRNRVRGFRLHYRQLGQTGRKSGLACAELCDQLRKQ